MKVLVFLLLASVACRSLTGRWPWQVIAPWLRSADPGRAATRACTLLGVADDASREDILAAHRKLLFEVHPDRGGNAALVHEANAARDLLLARLGPANRPS